MSTMSKPSPSAHSTSTSETSTGASSATFENPGHWDHTNFYGPALTMPHELLNVPLKTSYIVEFLNLGSTLNKSSRQGQVAKPRKNHVVVMFPLGQLLNGKYRAVRLSMDLSDSEIDVIDNHEPGSWFDKSKIPGHDFYPGTLNVKFLVYDTKTNSALHTATFEMQPGLSLGNIIAAAVTHNMHRFVFMPYGEGWKGCRDFNLQLWYMLAKKNWVHMHDANNNTLVDAIPYIYQPDDKYEHKAVDTGTFLRFSRVKDAVTSPAYVEHA